jgi:hypothetical protein
MKAITLRNLPPEVARRLARKAHQERLSLNRAAIRALEEAFGVARKKAAPVYHDLDFLIGSLSEEDARILDRSLKAQRKIDPEIWA